MSAANHPVYRVESAAIRPLVNSVSLVIPVRDEAGTIRNLTETIKCQTRPPDEVIFVDGGSHDGTVEILRKACEEEPTFRLVTARKALPGQGRNIGVANAAYDWIAFTDAGNHLEDTWLQELIKVADTDPETAIVCGNFEPVLDSFFKQCAAISYLPTKMRRDKEYVRGPFIASSLVRRDVWHAAGGFPDLRAAEDLIFFEELERKGFKFKWAPNATVHWEMQPDMISTFRRFFVFSRANVWAKRQRFWHYGVARHYLISFPFLILAIWKSYWWLIAPLAEFATRVFIRVWDHRGARGFLWVLNPVRFGYVAIITLTLDLATFSGWLAAILKRSEAARIADHMHTRRGDQAISGHKQ